MNPSIATLDQLPQIAGSITDQFKDARVFCFYGSLGAGKTTLIKEICKQLGAQDRGSSPTFSIINEYHSPNGPIYHFDLYRLKSVSELYDLGYEEYLDSGNYCFIEWPEKIESLLPEKYIRIRINVKDRDREISVEQA